VELDDGTLAHLGFNGKNGHPYVAIGKVLKDMGELSGDITADKIRTWLKKNPSRNAEVLHANPSYIFFKETKEESPGAFGVTLTGGRSLAVDRASIPLGIPVQVETTNTYDNSAWSRLMFAQDVGSAIKGPGRGDIYFGHGPLAGKRAGAQNAPGSLYAYVPKENVGQQAIALTEPEKPAQPEPAPTPKPSSTSNDFQPLVRLPEGTLALDPLPEADSSTTQPDLPPLATQEPAATPEQLAEAQPETLEQTPPEETPVATPFAPNSPADRLAKNLLKNVQPPNPLQD
jgi:3D (Asp-Asp-Asp) domain-containing protein